MANDGYGAPQQGQRMAPQAQRPGPVNGAGPRPEAAARPAQTPVAWAQDTISGSCATADEARTKLRSAAGRCHIVGGSSSIVLPIGHDVIITVVPIIFEETYQTSKPKPAKPGEVPQEERRGIGKSTLMQVAAAAGVQWMQSFRLPPMGDPLFVRWKAVGGYRDLTGQFRLIEGDRDSDFRDNSPQIAGKTPGDIAGLRSNIMRSTATKAKLRAIREAFGIPASMTLSELQKPFVVARLVMTGNVADRQDRAVFINALVQQSTVSAGMLYGTAHAPQPIQMGGGQGGPAYQLGGGGYGPPAMLPQGGMGGSYIDPAGEGYGGNPEGEEAGSDMPPPPPPAPPAPEPVAAAAVDWSKVKSAGDFVMPFGKDKGKKLSELDGRSVDWWRKAMEGDIGNPEKAAYQESSLARLKAIYMRLNSEGEVTPLTAPPPPQGAAGAPAPAPPPSGNGYAAPDNDGR